MKGRDLLQALNEAELFYVSEAGEACEELLRAGRLRKQRRREAFFSLAAAVVLLAAGAGVLRLRVSSRSGSASSEKAYDAGSLYACGAEETSPELSAGDTACTALFSASEEQDNRILILFTHDIHSHLAGTAVREDGTVKYVGGAARLATMLAQEEESFGGSGCIYVDGGDFSQGTLFQAGYVSDALELRLLGRLGCSYTTIGNHEWDLGGTGFAGMLESAAASGEKLPGILCSNLDFSGTLTEEQQTVQSALADYEALTGCSFRSAVETLDNGLTIGIFGLSGLNSIEDSPTSGMRWTDYIEEAKTVSAGLRDRCDLILCLSHSGTDSAESGEDIELAKECPDIDVIISAHSHSSFDEPVVVGDTLIVSCGEYLSKLGVLELCLEEDGSVSVQDYHLDYLDESVEEDPEILLLVEEMKEEVEKSYLADYQGFFEENGELSFDRVIAHSSFDFISLSEMYATHDEYPLGDLIADSYLYEAEKQGISDIDVALVGLGTIRGSISEGDLTISDAFDICSLGAGEDNSAGHPLVAAYITGAELKLLLNLDSSMGPLVSSIKMSYAGLRYSFNTERMLLDRVTEAYIVSADGTEEEIEDSRLYKICCNLYAANMLGMLNSLTKGILKITPRDETGALVTDFSQCAIYTEDGREIKEWVAFADYLCSFEKNGEGISEIPESYRYKDGRKYRYSSGGLDAVRSPGLTTILVMVFGLILFAALILILGKLYRKYSTKERTRHRDRGRRDSVEFMEELEGKEKRHRDRYR